MERIKEQVERWKGKAEVFLKYNIPAFIVDTSDNYYFCHILIVGEDYLYVENFKGNRKGEKSRIVWYDIIKFSEYRKENELNKKKEVKE